MESLKGLKGEYSLRDSESLKIEQDIIYNRKVELGSSIAGFIISANAILSKAEIIVARSTDRSLSIMCYRSKRRPKSDNDKRERLYSLKQIEKKFDIRKWGISPKILVEIELRRLSLNYHWSLCEYSKLRVENTLKFIEEIQTNYPKEVSEVVASSIVSQMEETT